MWSCHNLYLINFVSQLFYKNKHLLIKSMQFLIISWGFNINLSQELKFSPTDW